MPEGMTLSETPLKFELQDALVVELLNDGPAKAVLRVKFQHLELSEQQVQQLLHAMPASHAWLEAYAEICALGFSGRAFNPGLPHQMADRMSGILVIEKDGRRWLASQPTVAYLAFASGLPKCALLRQAHQQLSRRVGHKSQAAHAALNVLCR